ncbi:uncharacterized protein LY89DRAFT_753994 [Mollisia scopiformis]|uniref:Protein kinase domain-containing protein n=1 Tax=Mollisia scopiformis TaxID=149040 RepID=A0A194WZG6_MOLSC|nr:uncharacterized protein LY89DRAFT_753994 [Mollisia scopiformis]KUJ13343.1 hypothetical protein LY89DRAFT_753994 [Mollisia scopiformis]
MAYHSDGDYGTLDYHTNGIMACNSADHTADDDATHNDQFDVMRFMSVIVRPEDKSTQKWNSSVLLSIHLGPWNLFLPFTPYCGASFSVTLIPRRYVLRQTAVSLDFGPSLPELVALKTPRLGQDGKRNAQLFRSIAKEYQILQSESLKHHENIISVYGCCWQSLDIYAGLPIPCLLLEGSEFGDLLNFSRTRELTLRERLRICIHVTSGLQAIHSIGIVHGDLKPQNILIFHSTERGYTAKIADFGSAIVLGVTTLPSKRPIGTILYSAPECYHNDVTLGREELFKTDIFSLGIVLSALIQGMYVLEEMKKLSCSRLESLKKEGELHHWLIALSLRDSKNLATQDNIESADNGKGWEADPAFDEDSILADEQIWATFVCLLKGTLAAQATQRFASEETILSILRNLLCSHLRRTLGRRETASGAISTEPTPRWWSRMSSVLDISKARLRKVTGAAIPSPIRLDPQEIEAISLRYLLGKSSNNFFRVSQFIRQHTTNKQPRRCRSSKWRWRARRSLARRRQTRASFCQEADTRLIYRMTEIAKAWIKNQLVTPTELKIIGTVKKIFKVTQDSNLFWLLPLPVKTLLEDRLLHEATNSTISKDDQAEAGYEYAVMVINSVGLSAPRLVKALEILAQSAKIGHIEARSTCGRLHEVFGYSSPIPRKVEIEWLLAASEQGSLIAQERLQALDPKLFNQAIQNSRCRYGVVCPKLVKLLNEQYQCAMESGDPSEILFGHIHCLASTGNIQLLLRLPNLPRSVYNCVNCIGETPLLIACRGGHATTAALLLERGSDPRIPTKDGVTALHFLSAFDNKHIPKIAALLLKHGAELDKLSGSALIYKEMADSPFGVAEGTPLLWAVAARNPCATQVLVDKGANPFKRIQKSSNVREHGFEASPIGFGAMFHQYQLLKILLSYAKTNTQRLDLRRLLNTSFSRSHNTFTTALPIAIDCNPSFRFREYLIHGKDFEQIPVKCVQLLIEYGADPMILSHGMHGKGDHPITIACISGNISILEYLWDYKNGSLRPTPILWLSSLQQVIFGHHRLIFDFLIEHRGDIAPDPAVDKAAVEKCFLNTNDQHFVMRSLKLILQPTSADLSSDHTELFEVAVTTGQLEAAKLLFQDGGVHLTGRLVDSTILGNLISVSSNYPNMEQKVAFILSLIPNRDELFWNVSYLDGSGLTALQAIVFSSTNGGRMNAGVFCNILDHFNDRQYLNSQVKGAARQKYTEFTALHLAAQCGNSDAVTMLLHNPMVNANLLNSHGESPADICVAREQEFARRGKFQPHGSVANNERQDNLQILRDLMSAGGRISKFSTIIGTPAQDDYDVESVVNRLQDIFISGMFCHETHHLRYKAKKIN